jgi:hypothetical protein
MINSRFLFLSLAAAACTGLAYAIGRDSRQREKQQLGEGLQSWEDEGGNPAPAPAATLPPPVV